MAQEQGTGGGKDLDISQGGAGNNAGTQTQGAGNGSDAGNGQPDNGSGNGTGNGGDGAPGGDKNDGEGDTNPATGKPWTAEEWRDKFRNSAKGAQELLTKLSTIESERDGYKGEIANLSKTLEDLKKIAEGKNPDGLKAHELQAQLNQTSEKLALLTEEGSLDKFEKSVPLATGKVRESLKALARANPKESLQSLYDTHLKAGAEATEAKRKADEEARTKGAGDKGKGTSTREPAGNGNTVAGSRGDTGLSLEEFNALPVAKRKALIEKFGIA